MASTLRPGELLSLDDAVTPTAKGIASQVLARTAAGNVTLLAFDAGQELSEHTAPFDALVLTLAGSFEVTIRGREVKTAPRSIVLMPANVPHAVRATEVSRMVLIMLREREHTRAPEAWLSQNDGRPVGRIDVRGPAATNGRAFAHMTAWRH